MRYAGFLISFAGFLFVNALLLNAPVVLVLWLARRRITPRPARVLLASGFAAATFYMLYRIEWFDVWRHGMPSLTYLASGYLPWVALAGAAGWAIAARVTSQIETAR
jgi:hypothetical protein